MQHVHTPADAVSKLKKAAKLRVRAAPNLLHAHALDQVAKEAGYRHWKHVTACATNSGSSTVAVATARTCTSDRHPMQLQDFTIVCGPSGSGKTLMAYDYALNAVREGRTVRVADVGGSYAKLAEVVGGTMLRVNSNGFNSQAFGDVPLTVADFEGAKAAGAGALDAGSFPFVTNAGAGEVWIVDETETLPLSVKELRLILERHLAAGGSVLVTIQQSPESALAQTLAEIPTSSNVRRAMVTLSRFQPMR